MQVLKTTNKTVAIAFAEEMYGDRRGRLSVGARPVSITSRELVNMYEKERRKKIENLIEDYIKAEWKKL